MKRIIVGPHLKEKPLIVRPHASAMCRGEVQCSVVDSKTGKVIREYPKQSNLLLNTFMNRLPTVLFGDMFKYCAASTGTTLTAEDSGVTVAVQDGSQNVTLSGGSVVLTNTGTDAGRVIVWDSGEIRRILTVGSPTTCVVAPEGYNAAAPAVSSGQFTFFNTQRTNFSGTELKRSPTGGTSQYLTGAGNCGPTYANDGTGNVTLTRTYDFSAESGNVSYGEIGFSDVITAGSNLNSVILLASPVPLVTGNQLRVKYSLIVTLSPILTAGETVSVSPITGWSTATGHQKIQLPQMSFVDTNGATQAWATGASPLDPSSISNVFITVSPSAAAFNAYLSNGPDRSSGATQRAVGLSSYTPFTYYNEKSYTYLVGEANGTVRSIILGSPGAGLGSSQAFVYLIDSDQTKLSTYQLQIVMRLSWGRVLA